MSESGYLELEKQIDRIGCYVVATQLGLSPHTSSQTLVGTDVLSKCISALGGVIDEHENDPYEVAAREARDEAGGHLRFLLWDPIPEMFWTCYHTGTILQRRPELRERVVLRIYWRVLDESTFRKMESGDKDEIRNPRYQAININDPRTEHGDGTDYDVDDLRIVKLRKHFLHALRRFNARGIWPALVGSRCKPDFDYIYEWLINQNVDPKLAARLAHNHGPKPVLSGEWYDKHDELLGRLAQVEPAPRR